MNLQAKRIEGSSFSAEDVLEVVLDTANQSMAIVLHSVELVSGVSVTHGGGASAGTYLHYKALERDADANGVIDYSNVEMHLAQEVQGTSIIKVKVQYATHQMLDDYATACQAWENEPESAEKATVCPALTYLELTTGEISLEWSEDSFV